MKSCSKCGAPIADESLFCSNCGVKVANDLGTGNIAHAVQKEIAEFCVAGHNIYFDSDIVAVGKLRSLFSKNALKASKEFINFYKLEVKCYEDIYEKALPRIINDITESVKFGVATLMKFGVEDIDFAALMSLASEDIDPSNFLKEYIQIADELQMQIDLLSQYREVNRLGRGRWQGGGFGLQGAIKGALLAGALNFTNGAFHGIGDCLQNSSDKAKIQKIKNSIYKDADNCPKLSNGLYKCCFLVFYSVWRLLEDFPGVDFNTTSCDAKLRNYTEQYESGASTKDAVIKQACECIQINPFKLTYYLRIYNYCGDAKDLYPLAAFWGIEEEFKTAKLTFDKCRLAAIQKYSETSPAEIALKIKSLEELQTRNNNIGIASIINKLRIKALEN